MAEIFRLGGSYESSAAVGAPSGSPVVVARLDERLPVKATPTVAEYLLTNDQPVAVSLASLPSGAHLVIVKSVGGKILLTLTSADGSAQVVPVDSLAVLISEATPYTAITIGRGAGSVATSVKIVLAEKG